MLHRGLIRGAQAGLASASTPTRVMKMQAMAHPVAQNQKRGMAFYRQVAFPPRPSWALGFLVFFMAGSQFVEHALELAETDAQAEELVRQARSEAWGIERVVEALHELHHGLQVNHGTPGSDFMNAAPLLTRAGVLHQAILPGLRSDEPSVVDPAANMFCDLVSQRRIAKSVLHDSELVDALIKALTQWHESVCLDCGDPVSALDVLVRSVSSLAFVDAQQRKRVSQYVSPFDKHVPEIIPVINKLAALVEKGRGDVRESFKSMGASIRIEGSWRSTGRMSPNDRLNHADNVRLEIWYQDLGMALVKLCESLVETHPERAAELVPAFAALSRGLGLDDLYSRLQDLDWEEVLLTAPTLDLGLAIMKEVSPSDSAPPNMNATDWSYMQRLRSKFDEVDKSGWMSFIRKLEKAEDFLDPFMTVGVAGFLGFFWGAMRTFVALRGVTDPSTIMERTAATSTSWFGGSASPAPTPAAPPTVGSLSPNGGFNTQYSPGTTPASQMYNARGAPLVPPPVSPPPPPHATVHAAPYPGGSVAPPPNMAHPGSFPGTSTTASHPPPMGHPHPYPASNPYGSPGYNHGMHPPPNQPHGAMPHGAPHGVPNMGNAGSPYGGGANWKRAVAARYGRMAGTGAMVLIGLHEVSKVASDLPWFENGSSQIILGGIKATLDIATMTIVFINAPYSFVPSLVTFLFSQDVDFSDRFLLETAWGSPWDGDHNV